MSVSEGPLQAKSSFRIPVVSGNALLATIAVAFVMLHIVGIMILTRAAADTATPAQEHSRPSSYD